MGLSLHNNKKRVAPLEQGVDFVGYVIKPHRTLLRGRVIRNLNRKLGKIISQEDPTYENYAPSLNSYLGFLRQVSGYNKRQRMASRLLFAGIEMSEDLTKVL